MNAETYRERLEALNTFAAGLGLELPGWGAVPIEAPEIELTLGDVDQNEAPVWTCPHCKAATDELKILESGINILTSEAEEYEDEVTDRHAYWPAFGEQTDTDTVAYQCPECGGFVTPADDVEWS